MSSDSGSSFDTSLSRISLGRKSFWDTQRGNKSVKLQFLVNLNCITIWFNLTLIFNLCLECNKGQYGLSQVKACPSQFLKGLFFCVYVLFGLSKSASLPPFLLLVLLQCSFSVTRFVLCYKTSMFVKNTDGYFLCFIIPIMLKT